MTTLSIRHKLTELGRHEEHLYRTISSLTDDEPVDTYIEHATALYDVLLEQLILVRENETSDTVSEEERTIIDNRFRMMRELEGHIDGLIAQRDRQENTCS